MTLKEAMHKACLDWAQANHDIGIPVAIGQPYYLPDAIIAAVAEAGWVLTPKEPTLEMLEAGYEAGRAVHLGGVSGMTVDAQIRAKTRREATIYAAMLGQIGGPQ